jgi:hypothetical protein
MRFLQLKNDDTDMVNPDMVAWSSTRKGTDAGMVDARLRLTLP